MSERIEVGDVVLHEGKEFTVQDTRSVYIGQGSLNALLIDDNRWVSTSVVKLFAKKAPQVFEVGDTFTHMHGYDAEVFTVAAVLILCTMKRIKTAANKLGEAEGQKFIWEMLQATAKAAKVLSEIRDRSEAAAKALQGGAK